VRERFDIPDVSVEENRLSSKNIALVRTGYQALVSGDLAAFLRFLSPEIRITQPPELPWGGEFRGRSGARMLFVRLAEYLEAAIDIETLIDAGARVAAIGRIHGRTKGSGRGFDAPLVHLWEVRDGLAVRLEIAVDVPKLLAALARAA
jgi:hypothetical protein